MSLPFAYDPNIGSRDSLDEVYNGFWINHVHGRTYGATLTLDRQRGAFLIAFLALFVGTAGKSFWKIVRYALHHVYSSTKVPDGVYHQRQAILCNTPSALDAALDIVNISWAWRKRATKVVWRTFPSLILALLVSIGFTCAGIFSSRVAFGEANEVLLSGKQCGVQDKVEQDNYEALFPFYGIKLSEHLTYAFGCYQQQQSHQLEQCQTYIRSRLPYTVDTNAPCPFAKDICLYQDQNIILDTGLLDSEKDFGINGGQHFLFRSVKHCAPLVTEGHTIASSDDTPDEAKTLSYNYGEYRYEKFPFQASVFPMNATADTIRRWVKAKVRDYRIEILRTKSMRAIGDFTSSPEIHRSDASVSLLFLSAPGIIYDRKVTDPWFSATTPIDKDMFEAITGFDFDGLTHYISEQPATVLGCTRQEYFCNPDVPKDAQCINFDEEGGDTTKGMERLWPDPVQRASFYGAMASMKNRIFVASDSFLNVPGLPALMARFGLSNGKQINIDTERQWQKEIEFTFQASLVSMQSSLVETAKGAIGLPNRTSLCQPEDACKSICKKQKIRSPRHYSFSVLGVSIILAVGGTIMLIGLFLEELVSTYSKLRHRKSSRSYAQLEWQTTSVLQLQRLAHEGIGAGTWSSALDTVPVTKKGDAIGILDTSDEKHPRLVRPEAWSGEDAYDTESKPDTYSSVDRAPSSHRSVSPIPSVYSYDAVRSRYSAVSDVSDEETFSEPDRSSQPPP